MQTFLQKWKTALIWTSSKGIPLPLLRNPKHQEASVTFTMLVLSYAMCVLGATNLVSAISFEHSFELFMAVSALYFGRNFQKHKPPAIKEEKITNET